MVVQLFEGKCGSSPAFHVDVTFATVLCVGPLLTLNFLHFLLVPR